YKIQFGLSVARVRRDDDALLFFCILRSFLKNVEPDQVFAKPSFVGVKLDKAAQHQFGLLKIAGLFKDFQLKKLNAKILVANERIAVEDLHRALGITAIQALGGKDDHGAGVLRIDGERCLCVAKSTLGVLELEQQSGPLRQRIGI